jgi:hypothetical protein
MHDAIHPHRSAGRRQCDRVTEALDKIAPAAACSNASKPACLNIDLDETTVGRQIDQASPVAAMDPTRNGTAFRTGRLLRARPCHYDDLRGPDLDAIDSKARCVSVAVLVLRHICDDSLRRLNQPLCHPRHANHCTKSESEPAFGADWESKATPIHSCGRCTI